MQRGGCPPAACSTRPADNPQVIGICIIDEPEGIYYGGTVAAPVIKEVFDNILPYLGIEKSTK